MLKLTFELNSDETTGEREQSLTKDLIVYSHHLFLLGKAGEHIMMNGC